MKKSVWTALLCTALTISLTANVLLLVLWPREKAPTVPPVEEDGLTMVTTVPTQSAELMDISTPYGTMQYPLAFRDYVHSEAFDEADGYVQAFFYLHGDEKIEMFRIHVVSGEAPAAFGSIQKDGQTLSVGVSSSEYGPDDSWSEEEITRYRAMTMAINDVIASVKAWDNYVG